MIKWKIGADTWAFREMKLRDFVPSLGSLEFDCINLSSVSGVCAHVLPEHSRHRLEMLKRICESNGLPISAVHTGLALGASDRDEREDAVDLFRRYVEVCTVLSAKTIIIDLAGMRENEDAGKVVERSTSALKGCADVAAGAGIVLAIETDSETVINTAELDRRLIDAVGAPNVGANYNVGNICLSGHDPLAAIDVLSGKIRNVHLKDVLGRKGRLSGCPIGEGTVDFDAVLNKLRQAGYDGPIIVEYEGDASPLAGIKACLENLESVLSGPGGNSV